jgi:DNA-binding CsgD family transcriptional regulator
VQDLEDALAWSPKGRVCFFEPGPQAGSPIDLGAEIEAFLDYFKLTKRQSEILKLALRGYPSSTIAQKLKLTQGTVRNHRKEIYAKMDVTTEREIFLAFFNFMARR